MTKRTISMTILAVALLAMLIALLGSNAPANSSDESKTWPTADGRYLRESRDDSGQWRVSYAVVRGGKVAVEHGLIEGMDSVSAPVKKIVDAVSPTGTRHVKSDRCGKVVFYPVKVVGEMHGLQKGFFPAKVGCTILDATGKWKLLAGAAE
jgi:hypothetical protein